MGDQISYFVHWLVICATLSLLATEYFAVCNAQNSPFPLEAEMQVYLIQLNLRVWLDFLVWSEVPTRHRTRPLFSWWREREARLALKRSINETRINSATNDVTDSFVRHVSDFRRWCILITTVRFNLYQKQIHLLCLIWFSLAKFARNWKTGHNDEGSHFVCQKFYGTRHWLAPCANTDMYVRQATWKKNRPKN